VTLAPPRRHRKAPPADPTTAYARAVIAGEIVTGQLVRQACERHIADLERADLRFDVAEAARAIAFFGHLTQHKGRWAYQPLTLQPWQAFAIGSIMGWKLTDGRRRFRHAYVSVARKNGKTTLAAGLALFLLDFDEEPGAEIYAAATKRDQARICWEEAAWMVRNSADLKSRIRVINSRANMHVMETASKFEALGKDLDSLDGKNVHAGILDELHAQPNREVVDALEKGTGAREQPLIFYITTAGLERESIYSETDDYARRIMDGSVENDTWFVYLATLDPEDDWQDTANYIKANPSLGVTLRPEDLEQERDEAMQKPGMVNTFKRKRLNLRTGQFSARFTPESWDACRAPFEPDDLAGRECYAGLDLASTTDVAAFVLVFPDPEGDYVLPYFWVPEQASARRWEREGVAYPEWIAGGYIKATEGNITDYDVIREDIRELAERFAIKEIAYDRWNATQLITQLTQDGATCVPIGQGYASLSAPAKHFEAQVYGQKLRHDGNPVLRWMMLNVQYVEDAAGNVKPSRDKSADKIDGPAAIIDAYARAIVYTGPQKKGISVYVSGDEDR
jgi:phage terminase large subunit-like protein